MPTNDNNFNRMQEEAVRRVREMQRRSRDIASPPPAPSEPPPPKSSPLAGILSGVGHIDEEKALIGLLIYILYKQGADMKLLLGLGYLLL